MATTDCNSPQPRSKAAGRWRLIVPLLALGFQILPPLALWAISVSAYAEPCRLSESWERPVSLLAIALSAAVSLSLGAIGVYGLLVRSRPAVAALLILTCCIPALLAGSVYLHGLLILLAWV